MRQLLVGLNILNKILYKFKKQNLGHLINKLDVLNPMNTLKRGYAIVKKDDAVVSDCKKLKVDDLIGNFHLLFTLEGEIQFKTEFQISFWNNILVVAGRKCLKGGRHVPE